MAKRGLSPHLTPTSNGATMLTGQSSRSWLPKKARTRPLSASRAAAAAAICDPRMRHMPLALQANMQACDTCATRGLHTRAHRHTHAKSHPKIRSVSPQMVCN